MTDVNTASSAPDRRLAHPRRDRHRAAHGHPRPDGDEHRAAIRPARPALHHGGPAVGGHRLFTRVRQPAAAGRQAGRPARPQGNVPDRPGRLRRRLGHRRRLGQLHHARDRAGLPGRVRCDPGAVGAFAADHDVHRAEGPRQGVRHLRRDRRGRQRGRPAARRRPDRVLVLALDAVHQPGLRRRGLRRGSAAAAATPVPGQAEAGHPGRGDGVQWLVLPGLRILERGHARLEHAVHLRLPDRRRGAADRVRALAGPGRRTRCCRPAWYSTATAAAPTCRCSSPRPACSGPSCS